MTQSTVEMRTRIEGPPDRFLDRVQHYVTVLRKGPSRVLMWKALSLIAESQLRKRGCLDLLASRPAEALAPDVVDSWFLYRCVRARKPRCVLEFGSGFSTSILAYALWENQRESAMDGGMLYSVETDPHWLEVTRRYLPSHLQHLCQLWLTDLEVVEYQGTSVFRHVKLPEIVPDFLYLDGPGLIDGKTTKISADLLDLEESFPPTFYMVVDGRWPCVRFLREHLKRRYIFKHSETLRRSTFELIEQQRR